MRIFFLSIILLFVSLCVRGQNYMRDAGARIDEGIEVTYRKFYKNDMSVEVFASVKRRGFRFGGMRQRFKPALTTYSGNFWLYYGYGVHAGVAYTNTHRFFGRVYQYDWQFTPLFGMDGIAGLEYRFPEVPILVSADIRPYFEFSANQYFVLKPLDVTFSVKYRF